MDEGELSYMTLADLSIADISFADGAIEDIGDPVCCKCSGSCWYKTGKKGCPCKSGGQNCTASCSCGRRRPCSNRAPVADTTTDTSSDDEREPIPKVPRRATAKSKEDLHLQNVKKLVADLERDNLEKVAIMCLTRFPDAYLDVVSSVQSTNNPAQNPGPLAADNLHEDAANPPAPDIEVGANPPPPNPPPPNPPPPQDDGNIPWWSCGRCRNMPTDIEKVCCRIRSCVTTEQHFEDVVINGNVLATCMAASNDNFPRNIPRSNESYRHYAYKQHTYMHHGHLVAGNRHVLPSCVVWRVRDMYPNAMRQYKGFSDGMHD